MSGERYAQCECASPGCLCQIHDAPRPAGQDTGHRQTAESLLGAYRGGNFGNGDEALRQLIAAALAAADRDGYQRGREEMAREIGEWLDAADDVDLTTLTVEAVRRRIARALADRNDEKEGQ